MEPKSSLSTDFETRMDTIGNLVAFPYNWELSYCFSSAARVFEKAVDLVDDTVLGAARSQRFLFGYEVAYQSARRERYRDIPDW